MTTLGLYLPSGYTRPGCSSVVPLLPLVIFVGSVHQHLTGSSGRGTCRISNMKNINVSDLVVKEPYWLLVIVVPLIL